MAHKINLQGVRALTAALSHAYQLHRRSTTLSTARAFRQPIRRSAAALAMHSLVASRLFRGRGGSKAGHSFRGNQYVKINGGTRFKLGKNLIRFRKR